MPGFTIYTNHKGYFQYALLPRLTFRPLSANGVIFWRLT